MNRYPAEDIVVFDDEEETLEQANKENCIVVFDDEEKEAVVEQKSVGMSKKDFDDCCSKLSERIIFSNLKNFSEGISKPTPTFFQDARNKRRESQAQRQSQRHLPKPPPNQRPSLASEMPKDVKVDFLPVSPFRRQSIEDSLRDELSPPDMQGACLGSSKRELRMEEQKDRNMLKVSNFREFLYTQLRPGYQVSLVLQKTESGLLTTTYKCFFPENGQFALAVQKSTLGGYLFSSSQVHFSQEHISFLAKLDSDFMGKEFRFYDAGEDCSKTKIMENYKKQMGYIAYNQEKDQPRRFTALLSTCDNALTDFTVIDRKAQNVLFDRWQRGQQEHIVQLKSRDPSFDPSDRSYKLDFQGLAGVASTKNFILENEDHPQALIFGRQDKDNYMMQVKAPFSILQAVAVALSSIHYKFL